MMMHLLFGITAGFGLLLLAILRAAPPPRVVARLWDATLPALQALGFGLGGLGGMFAELGWRESTALGILCAYALPAALQRWDQRHQLQKPAPPAAAQANPAP